MIFSQAAALAEKPWKSSTADGQTSGDLEHHDERYREVTDWDVLLYIEWKSMSAGLFQVS